MSVGGSEAASPPDLGIRYELLPLVCDDRRVAHLRVSCGRAPAWWISPRVGQPPTQAVVSAGRGVLGDWFDPAAALVHSTSWRHELAHEAIVLSFVALLCPPAAASAFPAGVLAEPLDLGEDGYVYRPASEIRIHDVIVHGLRHFAMLRRTDPAISAALSPGWHAVLARFEPRPAGLVDQHVAAAAGYTSTLPA